jgi:hypothetical protein
MSLIQRVALVFGAAFVAVGVIGFMVTGFAMPELHDMDHSSKLLGLFPVNVTHNLLHLGFGIWGLAASRIPNTSMLFALASGAIYFLLAGVGMIVADPLGVMPIGGWDVVLHLVIAALLVSFALFEAVRRAAPVPQREI